MTEATKMALDRIGDVSTLQWYVIPLLAIVFYVYAKELRLARTSGNWDAVIAGLTLFGMDFFNETWNGWVMVLTGRSALWTAPGPSALTTMVGWNIEIMFMFLLSGVLFYYTCSPDEKEKILGIPNRWFWAIGYSLFCLVVEMILNKAGMLVWEYPFWTRTLPGSILIFFFGYFHFYVAIILVLKIKTLKNRWTAVGIIYAVPVVMNLVARLLLGWKY